VKYEIEIDCPDGYRPVAFRDILFEDLYIGNDNNVYMYDDLEPLCKSLVVEKITENNNINDNNPQLHDNHYRNIEKNGTEPIIIMEELHERLINICGANEALNITLAQKHITRAGLKSGDDWRKDIQKAMNYLNRALNGEWMK
jgi:hypothetical protein